MTYTLNLQTGVVTRDSDGKQVAPCQSTDDPDFMRYQAWANDGNLPTVVDMALRTRRLTKLDFVALLGDDYRAILTIAKQNIDVEMFLRMLDWATPEPDGTSIDLDDVRVSSALNMLEHAGVISPGRAEAILRQN